MVLGRYNRMIIRMTLAFGYASRFLGLASTVRCYVNAQRMISASSDYRVKSVVDRAVLFGNHRFAGGRAPGCAIAGRPESPKGCTVEKTTPAGTTMVRNMPCPTGVPGRPTRHRSVTLLAVVLVSWTTTSALAQQRPLPLGGRPIRAHRETSPVVSPSSRVLIEPSAPVANLFSRAEEGVLRGDWKFTVDCLQRIIDDPDNSLVPRAGQPGEGYLLYESVRSEAMRRLASLPPEGLRTYRLLYDGKAKRLYELAERNRDPRHLRTVARRFLLTRYGDDASDLLASWALDEGRLDETITVLADLREFIPDSDVPGELIVAKLLAAYTLLGRTTEAESVSQELYRLTDGRQSIFHSGSLPEGAGLVETLLALQPLSPAGEPSPSSWPVVGGSPMRHGRMALVDPTLTDRVPWKFELPDRSADAWRRAFFNDPDGPLAIPATQLVADGDRLFVPTRLGCVAINANDLSLAWRSPPADLGHGAVGLAVHSVMQQSPSRFSRQVTEYEDHVTGVASVALGLVLVISREGRAQYTQGLHDTAEDDLLGVAAGAGAVRGRASGTRLVALDAGTGEFRWARGRTAQADDPLDGATFHSVPIAVGDALWVPYSRNGDLSVAVLDPVNGGLRHNVSLCSLQGQADLSRLSLPLAAGHGQVFIPSGHGALFCVDAYDHTVRWAGAYPIDHTSDDFVPNTRLPSPPVVAGGFVLLAPVENSQLLAFSTSSGRVAWSTPCEDGSYIIASDGRYIWLGGRSVECVAIPNGQLLWQTELTSAPTGWAVLSDYLVYVPTLDGLLSLHAESGEKIGYTTTPGGIGEHGPLGNLLCMGDAMFSISSSWVRKYPDIQRSYPKILSRHEADPTDPVVSLRLGWLELLRGEPGEALRVLDAVSAAALEGDDEQGVQVAHARVEAILAMAQQVTEPPRQDAQRLDLLRQAHQIAPTASDRLRCGLQMADLLRSMGQLTESFYTLWEIGVGPDADQVVSLAQQVAGLARVRIGQRLKEIREELTEEQLAEVAEHAVSDVERAVAALEDPNPTAALQRLAAAAELDPLGPAGRHARLTLSEREAAHKRFERAEQVLRSYARLDVQPAVVGSALMRLCGLFQEQGGEVLPLLAGCLKELEQRFGDQYVTDEWHVGGILNEGATSRTVSDWIVDMRADLALDRDPTGVHGLPIAGSGSPIEQAVLSGDVAWTLNFESEEEVGVLAQLRRVDELGEALGAVGRAGPPRAVQFATQASSVFDDRVVFQAPGDVVYCQRASDGVLLWHTTLRLPSRFNINARERWAKWVDMRRRAITDGQTAVFNGADGLFAVGLVTGRRIWARPYEDAGESEGPTRSDLSMAARDGLLAATPRLGRLALMRMLDGTTIWERDLRGERVQNVWMTEDRVLTADPVLERVHLFRRSNGDLIRRVLFEQPDPEARLVDVVRTKGSLCGPASTSDSDGLMAVDLGSGNTLWEVRLDKPLYALFKPQEGYLGVGLLGGDVRILDARTGDLIMERRVAGVHAVTDGVLFDGTFLVEYVTLSGSLRYHELTALDVATGRELWRREDVFPLGLPSDPLPVVGGRVPVALRPQGQGPRRRAPIRVTMLDLRTGSNVGEEMVLVRGRSPAILNGDLVILPDAGVVVIGLDKQIHALRIESATSSRPVEEFATEGA